MDQKGGEPRFVTFDQLIMAAKAVLFREMGEKVVSKKDVIEGGESVSFDGLDSVIERLVSRMKERKAVLEKFPWLVRRKTSEEGENSIFSKKFCEGVSVFARESPNMARLVLLSTPFLTPGEGRS